MRACYLPEIDLNSENAYEIEGEKFHHLKNVLRIKKGETVLFLNGAGQGRKYEVCELDKKTVRCIPKASTINKALRDEIHLCVGLVKKEALDLILKQCCELGIQKVYLAKTANSQHYPLNFDRLEKLLISGIEQANNYWLPLVKQVNLDEVPFELYTHNLLFSLHEGGEAPTLHGRTLLLVGPEGGFSAEEERQILNSSNSSSINLKTNILRSPTAVACALGYAVGRSV